MRERKGLIFLGDEICQTGEDEKSVSSDEGSWLDCFDLSATFLSKGLSMCSNANDVEPWIGLWFKVLSECLDLGPAQYLRVPLARLETQEFHAQVSIPLLHPKHDRPSDGQSMNGLYSGRLEKNLVAAIGVLTRRFSCARVVSKSQGTCEDRQNVVIEDVSS